MRTAVAILPLVLIPALLAAFAGWREFLGARWGYLAGCVTYWLICCLISWVCLGLGQIRAVLAAPARRLTKRERVLLCFPPAFAAAFALPRVAPRATAAIVVLSLAIAAVNALAEELLWPCVYVRTSPGSVWLGFLYPSVGFALWALCAPGGSSEHVSRRCRGVCRRQPGSGVELRLGRWANGNRPMDDALAHRVQLAGSRSAGVPLIVLPVSPVALRVSPRALQIFPMKSSSRELLVG